jgi:uncharacterized protein DUF4238
MAYGHYVPRFHMRNFGINEKQTARFDKKTNRPPIAVSIYSFCGEEDYFALDENSLINLPWYLQWIYKDLIEHRLCDHIEEPVSTILKTLIIERTLEGLSKEKMLLLLEWLAWMFIANPQSLAISSIALLTNNFKEIDYTKLSKTDRLKVFVDLHEQITPIFQQREWILQLIDPNHGYLLSSDRPVVIGGTSLQESPKLSTQTIFFPLSPQLLLIGNNSPVWGYASKPLESTKHAALMVNILTYDQSYRFMFGADIKHIDRFFKALQDESKV